MNLLLDLTHAKITALYRNWDIHDYIKELPLHHIKEIHVNGSGHDEQGFPADIYQSMTDEDYESRFNPITIISFSTSQGTLYGWFCLFQI